MIRRPPRSTRMTHSFPTRRSSDLVRAEVLPGVDAHDDVEEAILEGERPGVRLHGMDLAGQAEVTEHRLYHGRADPQVSGPDLHAELPGEEHGRRTADRAETQHARIGRAHG